MTTPDTGKKRDRLTVGVKVIPSSPQNLIVGYTLDELVIKIKSSPEKGKANRELISFLSFQLKIPKSEISIVRGETSRHKIITLPLSAHSAWQKLSPVTELRKPFAGA